MNIHRIHVKNFRLLEDIDLLLEKRATVIVGRNNSGKTSLTELFRRLLTESSASFRLQDFSLSAHEDFWKAFLLKEEKREVAEIRNALPFIEVRITISYDKDSSNLSPLSDFIIDLNPDCSEALIVIRYHLKEGSIDAFFSDLKCETVTDLTIKKQKFLRAIKERIEKNYSTYIFAEDPNDSTNRKEVEWTKLRALIQSGFINAQRGLDDTTHKDINLLGKILEALLNSAMTGSADPKDAGIAQDLEKAVADIQENIDGGFNKQLEGLLPAFSLFGYPGLKDPQLRTETALDVKRLLKDHTKVHYTGINGINLPEAYNGLGVRNLIYILLKLYEFFKSFMASESVPISHLIFIEEPEVHLHPQMQEVFISSLYKIADDFAKTFNGGKPWPVQFIVTTHSSHVANRAPFTAMRYFLTMPTEVSGIFRTRVKDLSNDLGGTLKEDREFLHKYMTLTRCDLLFADKAILIEGSTERLLLPKMIEKIDAEKPEHVQLANQYISVVEVGGAYAHRFLKLLQFLELTTLIVTDLDPAKKNAQNKLVGCKTSEGTHTSNGCIKAWFGNPDITPAELIKKSDEEKTKGMCRLAYEVPEVDQDPCGSSFEGAFILANASIFELTGLSKQEKEEKTREKAESVSTSKTDFALVYAIEQTEWTIPRYIVDGLRWLSKSNQPSSPKSLPSATEGATIRAASSLEK